MSTVTSGLAPATGAIGTGVGKLAPGAVTILVACTVKLEMVSAALAGAANAQTAASAETLAATARAPRPGTLFPDAARTILIVR
jgi:hypothetical protein